MEAKLLDWRSDSKWYLKFTGMNKENKFEIRLILKSYTLALLSAS